MSDLLTFLRHCSVEISRRAALWPDQPELTTAADFFAAALAESTPRQATASTVPVVSCLGDQQASLIGDALIAASPQIPWQASHRVDDDGTGVALGLVDQVRDLGELQCGLMLLGPRHRYPEHAHPPHEIYLPISGDGQWRYGGSTSYEPLDADELVYNRPNDLHGAIAGDHPLVALYILWNS